MINRNKELSLIYSIFLIKKEIDKNTSFIKIYNNFENFENFEKKILDLKSKLFNKQKQLSFFDLNIEEINLKINNLWKKTLKNWNDLNIKSISKFDFEKTELLKNIKNVNFLFYKGDSSLLNLKKEKIISIVGSRKTPFLYSEKINEKIFKDKVIMSGLALGADLQAHKKAKKLNKKIIIFPGKDIAKQEPNPEKQEILNYAEKNGLIFSEIFPNSNSWNKFFLLKRNKTMAQISSETYAVWFKGRSGTLGQILEAVRRKNKVYMFKEIYEENKSYFKNHNAFKEITKNKICLI